MKLFIRKAILSTAVLAILFSLGTETAYTREKNRKYFEERGEAVWEVPTNQKVIALTFDDGPSPEYTPRMLDLLKKYDAKATFFVVGSRVNKYPELVRREITEGHEVANHTYNHKYFTRMTPDSIKKEIKLAEDAIVKATNLRPRLFRPPGGIYNETIINSAKELDYLVVMWSWHQDTRDWRNPGVKRIVGKVLNNARKGDIVLFHDHGGKREQTIKALEQILPELTRRGYSFVTVSDLLQLRSNLKVDN
ncbi:polysaccharide deacetylase family protein [Brevibacillus massiliensis]|jgi:polysaccharide deacetylase family sporulation protein PdaB|uniref:polysaccharide deacetylase family protein n=1 Tax=Brevibacillus massiliensis TaxID=1118054 RepID=UPI0002E03727|nr:polysaccharide deacetylase family protein [Brevibacillus massiliensis]